MRRRPPPDGGRGIGGRARHGMRTLAGARRLECREPGHSRRSRHLVGRADRGHRFPDARPPPARGPHSGHLARARRARLGSPRPARRRRQDAELEAADVGGLHGAADELHAGPVAGRLDHDRDRRGPRRAPGPRLPGGRRRHRAEGAHLRELARGARRLERRLGAGTLGRRRRLVGDSPGGGGPGLLRHRPREPDPLPGPSSRRCRVPGRARSGRRGGRLARRPRAGRGPREISRHGPGRDRRHACPRAARSRIRSWRSARSSGPRACSSASRATSTIATIPT